MTNRKDLMYRRPVDNQLALRIYNIKYIYCYFWIERNSFINYKINKGSIKDGGR